jgi:hypothetical protein
VLIGMDARIDWLFGSNVFTLNVFKLEPIQIQRYGDKLTQMSDTSVKFVDEAAPLKPSSAKHVEDE